MLKVFNLGRNLSITQLVAHLRTPLYRNGYALVASGIISSGLGMIYWLVASHFYNAPTVGLYSAATSAIMLLSGIAQLSLSDVFVRFIPRAGQATFALIAYAYALSAGVTVIIALIFCWGLQLWAPALGFLLEHPLLFITFILAAPAWTLCTLQDSVLTGLRQTTWVPIENALIAIARLVLLISFAHSLQAYGIMASWAIPVSVALLPISFLIFYRFIPQHTVSTDSRAVVLIPSQIARYALGNYLGGLLQLASTTLLPIVVTNQAGPSANAHFFIPWMLAIALQFVPSNMTTSFTVEAVHDQTRLASYCYGVLLQSIRLLVPCVAVILLGATLILRIFGTDYASEGATLLRLLALATIPNMFVMLYIGLARVQNRVASVVVVQGILCVLLLSMTYLFLPMYGIVGVGLAALASQTCVAIGIMFTQLGSILQSGRIAYQYERARL